MDQRLSQTGASPKSVWKPKQTHAQNTLSQPAPAHAPAPEQIVHPHKLGAIFFGALARCARSRWTLGGT